MACSGTRSNDHCNAHGGHQVYRNMRAHMLACKRASPPVSNAAPPPAAQDAVESMLRLAAGPPAMRNAAQNVRKRARKSSAGRPSAPQIVSQKASNSTRSWAVPDSAFTTVVTRQRSQPAQAGPRQSMAQQRVAGGGGINSDGRLLLSAVETDRMLSAAGEAGCRHGLSTEMSSTSTSR